MSESVQIIKTIAVPADQTWQAIAGIGSLDRWFPVIAECDVVGNGVGATRILILTDGGEIRDRIEVIDHQDRSFRYNRFQSPFPVSRYIGIVNVRPVGIEVCEITWTIDFDLLDGKQEEFAGFLQRALSAGIDGMERDLLAPAAARPAL